MRSYLPKAREIILETLDKLGCSLVEIREIFGKEDYLVSIVIWKPQGISIDDCVKITRAALPKLQQDPSLPDYTRLEVASPGIDRKLKNPSEFSVFKGRKATVATQEKSVTGTIGDSDENAVIMETDGILTSIPLSQIKSAKLVD